MSQLSSSSFDATLMVRDAQGRYLPATADQILEAARKVVEQKMLRGVPFTSPAEVKEYLIARLAGLEHEVFAVIYLDAQHRVLDYVEMFRGTVSQTAVYPREIVKAALVRNSSALVLAHNHPSGNAEPSRMDQLLTQTLTSALALVGVRVIDHLIVSGSTVLSFAERGLL